MRMRLVDISVLAVFLALASPAAAQTTGEGGTNGANDASPLLIACDGALCDTTNDSSCALSGAPPDGSFGSLVAMGAALAGALRRRAKREALCPPDATKVGPGAPRSVASRQREEQL
jgi:MYXO-CTERM domain-containing protein